MVTATRYIGTVPEEIASFGGNRVDYIATELDGVEARVELEITEADGTPHVIHRAESFSYGTVSCLAGGYAMGTATLTIRARNIDWAGNTSDWVDVPVSGDIPDEPIRVTGCSTTPAPAPLVAWGLAALVVARRRVHEWVRQH